MPSVKFLCPLILLISQCRASQQCENESNWFEVSSRNSLLVYSRKLPKLNCIKIENPSNKKYAILFISKTHSQNPLTFESDQSCSELPKSPVSCSSTGNEIVFEFGLSVDSLFFQFPSSKNRKSKLGPGFYDASRMFRFDLVRFEPLGLRVLLNTSPGKLPKNDIGFLDEIVIILELLVSCLLLDISIILLLVKRKSASSINFHRGTSVLGLVTQIVVELKYLYDFRFNLFEIPLMYLFFACLLFLTVLMVFGVAQGLYLLHCLQDKYVYNDIRGIKRLHRVFGWAVFVFIKAHFAMNLYVYVLKDHYRPSLFLRSVLYADAGLVVFFLASYCAKLLLKRIRKCLGPAPPNEACEFSASPEPAIELHKLKLLIHKKNPTRNLKTFLLEDFFYVIDCDLILHLGGQFLLQRIDGWDITRMFYGVEAMQRVPLPRLRFRHSHLLISPKIIHQRRFKTPLYFFFLCQSVDVSGHASLFKGLKKKPAPEPKTEEAQGPPLLPQRRDKSFRDPRTSIISFSSKTPLSPSQSTRSKKKKTFIKRISKQKQKLKRFSKRDDRHSWTDNQQILMKKMLLIRRELQKNQRERVSRDWVSIRSFEWHRHFEWKVLSIQSYRSFLRLRVFHESVDVGLEVLDEFPSLLGKYFLFVFRKNPKVYFASFTVVSLSKVFRKADLFLKQFLYFLAEHSDVFNIKISPLKQDSNASLKESRTQLEMTKTHQIIKLEGGKFHFKRQHPVLKDSFEEVASPPRSNWEFNVKNDLFVGHSFRQIEFVNRYSLNKFTSSLKLKNMHSFLNMESDSSEDSAGSDEERSPFLAWKRRAIEEGFEGSEFHSQCLDLLLDAADDSRSPFGLFNSETTATLKYLLSSRNREKFSPSEQLLLAVGGPFGRTISLGIPDRVLFICDESGLVKMKDFLFFLNLRTVHGSLLRSSDPPYLVKVLNALKTHVSKLAQSSLKNVLGEIKSRLSFFVLTEKSKFNNLVYPLLSIFTVQSSRLNKEQIIDSLILSTKISSFETKFLKQKFVLSFDRIFIAASHQTSFSFYSKIKKIGNSEKIIFI